MKKKRKIKKLQSADIQSLDKDAGEQEEDEPLPEDFHLLEESIHCMNVRELEGFKAYLKEICTEFMQMVKRGRGVEEEHKKWSGAHTGHARQWEMVL